MSDDQTPSIHIKITGGVAGGANAQATGEGGSITNHYAPSPVAAPPPSPAPQPRHGPLQSLRAIIEGTVGSLIATFITR